jgi:hypothetical protein
MGDYLCPRCTIPEGDVRNLGTQRDRQIREQSRRLDDDSRKNMVDAARNFIYKDNYAVNYQRVEALLKPTSLVPSRVCLHLISASRALY